MVRRAWFAFLTFAVCGAFSGGAQAQLGGLLGRRTDVPEIEVEKLRQLQLTEMKVESEAKLNGTKAPESTFVIVDVRTPEESSVSMIPGAISKSEFEKNRARYRDRTVITYCTSGYRSGKYAKQLAGEGIKVTNFKGSILGWCHAELPLVTPQGEPTNRVHTANSKNRVPAKYEPVW